MPAGVSQEFPISYEVDGRPFVGRRVVRGTRLLYQTVFYGDLLRRDLRQYHPEDAAEMEHSAQLLLEELVRMSRLAN